MADGCFPGRRLGDSIGHKRTITPSLKSAPAASNSLLRGRAAGSTSSRRRTAGVTIGIMADAKNSLKSIVEWLDGTDEAGWERQIELGEQCRSEMERTARPKYSGARKGSHQFGPERNPDAGKLNRAASHVRAMLSAMRNRNRAAALEHGRAAMAVM